MAVARFRARHEHRPELQRHADPASDRFPDARGSCEKRAAAPRDLGEIRTLREDHRRPQGLRRTRFHPPRRPALRQWRCPHGHRAQQAAQGHGGEIQDHGRLPRALRPRLGLPRPAHRVQGRQAGGRPGACGNPPPLRRVRSRFHRYPARLLQAPRGLRRLGKPIPDDGTLL